MRQGFFTQDILGIDPRPHCTNFCGYAYLHNMSSVQSPDSIALPQSGDPTRVNAICTQLGFPQFPSGGGATFTGASGFLPVPPNGAGTLIAASFQDAPWRPENAESRASRPSGNGRFWLGNWPGCHVPVALGPSKRKQARILRR